MRAMQQGLHVYTQKPLTQTIYESRRLREVAHEKKLVSQMGIQIHSAAKHRIVVATIQAGAIGKVKEVYSWSGKDWGEGEKHRRPDRKDEVPASLNWDGWLGVAAERPFIGKNYYHPGNWRKRLDFGTGTFGDMGCHILDPVYGSLALTAPTSARSEGGAPNDDSWGLEGEVRYVFPGTKYTADTLALTWYHGSRRPPADIQKLVGGTLVGQGSIYVGTEGVLYSQYDGGQLPVLGPAEKFADYKIPSLGSEDHYLQFVEACRGNGKTSAPFDYSGPLTESVLLGCLATRFPKTTLEWDAAGLKVTNVKEANQFVRRTPRKGWEVEGL
jgi:predicted dehydrogenase